MTARHSSDDSLNPFCLRVNNLHNITSDSLTLNLMLILDHSARRLHRRKEESVEPHVNRISLKTLFAS